MIRFFKLCNIKFSIWLYETAFKWDLVPEDEREINEVELMRWELLLKEVNNG